jgi:hypothetical protein
MGGNHLHERTDRAVEAAAMNRRLHNEDQNQQRNHLQRSLTVRIHQQEETPLKHSHQKPNYHQHPIFEK